ncbi:RNA-guided pseudouridylation complex pseudouridine synthase subunit Cbf5 [Candidatus Woesearchaeota archaeon]|nr:RNA-guided pseudouridylation complex pseudouridine synthase subunit Cbf5 [Candidatus Woesearchaeota archaeon]
MNLLPFEGVKRKILVKKESETSDKYGGDPYNRPMDQHMDMGIINVDKPKGPTSHQVSAYIQKILETKKGGHSGTLDPKVTGCLPVAIGRATRIVQALLVAGKEYVCLMHLHKEVQKADIEKVFKEFTGKITQLPPLKSAVKRQVRSRKIYYMELLDIQGQDVLFVVGCQAGTYIRKLCHDMGKSLGTGAHMQELRRTKAGPFNESTLASMHDLVDAYHFYKTEQNEKFLRHVIQPVENAVSHLSKVWVLDTTVDSVCHGAALAVPGISRLEERIEPDQTVAILSLKGELIALGLAKMTSDKIMKSSKGLAIKTKKVFMEPGTYPKVQKKEP